MTTIMLSAGDLSGERHAAELAREILRRRPEARLLGMGGDAMSDAGVELVFDQRNLAVGGFLETVGSLARIRRGWRAMLRCARQTRPELVILVDSGGFNLPLARRLRAMGTTRILYYVAPQVWAWREGRISRIAERTDRIAVILPFEKAFWATRGVEVDYVGHPLVDRVAPVDEAERVRARAALGLAPEARVLALFPGSRRNELAQHLALQLETAARLRHRLPGLVCLLGLAGSLDDARTRARIARSRRGGADVVQVVRDATDRVIAAADVALAKPGTITAELMLAERPMVVTGRVHPLTALLTRRALGRVRWALPNLLLDEEVVPERMQGAARPDRLVAELAPLFEGPARRRQLEGLDRARRRLGGPGATARAADIVEEMLGSARP